MVAGSQKQLPDGVRIGTEELVKLTPPAGTKAAALIQREQQGGFLRVAISGGGCNGLAYKLLFIETPRIGV
jgi:iron-sulfur cluster assembly protein